MPRHYETFASRETFDPNMIDARERLIWLQRLRSGHEIWDEGLPYTADTAAQVPARATAAAVQIVALAPFRSTPFPVLMA